MPIATRIARPAITRRRRFLPMGSAVSRDRRLHPVGTNRRKRIQPAGMPVTTERATGVGIDKFLALVMVDISDLRWAGLVGTVPRAAPKARNVSQLRDAGAPSAGQCGKTP
jgi:hypothetical protein